MTMSADRPAINRMPLRALAHQGIPTSKLSHTKMTIQGYNADSLRAIGKIRLKCQLADLKSEITSYVIDNDTSYNLLLGRPWIHGNFVVPSTLYQCFKYVDSDKKVQTKQSSQIGSRGRSLLCRFQAL